MNIEFSVSDTVWELRLNQAPLAAGATPGAVRV
jgi:hypothetical protein